MDIRNVLRGVRKTRESHRNTFTTEDLEKYNFTKKELRPKIVCQGGSKAELSRHISNWGLSEQKKRDVCNWVQGDRVESLPVDDRGWVTSIHLLMFRCDPFRANDGQEKCVLAYFKKEEWSKTAKVTVALTGVGLAIFGVGFLIRYLAPEALGYLIDLAKKYYDKIVEMAKTLWGILFTEAAAVLFQKAVTSVSEYFNTDIHNAPIILLIILDIMIESIEAMVDF